MSKIKLSDNDGHNAAQKRPERTTEWVRELAKKDMMAIEAIVADVYTQACHDLSGFALFDGGAHQGYHTMRMGAQPGCEVVYAVEADPAMVSGLRKILSYSLTDPTGLLADRREKPTFRLVAQALQNDPAVKTITWKSSTSHIGRSSIASQNSDAETIWGNRDNIEYRDDSSIDATTIDLILEQEDRPIPFIKLDLEGADLLSLMGAEETLRTKRPIVAFENSIHAPKVHGFTLSEVQAYLDRLDYVAMNFVGEILNQENWFGFFEAWLAPAEDAEWLAEALSVALEAQAYKVDGGKAPQGEKDFIARPKSSKKQTKKKKNTAANDMSGPGINIVPPMSFKERHKKNADKKIAKGADKSLPQETRTIGWREMSADIAWAFWSEPTRIDQPVEKDMTHDQWSEQSGAYRSRIRSVMRSLVKEDLSFKQKSSLPAPADHDEAWMLATGRLAWILWLSGRRASHDKNESEEKRLWSEEAAAYRTYVRKVLTSIRPMGIVFAEK